MAGELEEFLGAFRRLRNLEQDLWRTTAQAERKILHARIEYADAEFSTAGSRLTAAADAGHREASAFLDALKTLLNEE